MPRQSSAQQTITVEHLWQMTRVGGISLSPDGSQAVCSATAYSMEENTSRSALWLLSTLGGKPRALTQCGDKDGQPRWSPQGDVIAFTARREQEGKKDDTAQLYVIPSDGGEARRVGQVPTGVDAFKWFPDGKRIAFVSWVWPELKGNAAQAKRWKEWKARKETGYATSQAQYRFWDRNLPQDRVPHLFVMDVASGRHRDLFEGTGLELPRTDPGASDFDVSPDNLRIAFNHDPETIKRGDARMAIGELNLRSGHHECLVRDAAWDCRSPRYSPWGERLAFVASHQGAKHTMPGQLALYQCSSKAWAVQSAEWDHEVNAPLHWQADGQALLFTAEEKGRCHVWRFDLPERRAEVVVRGGTVSTFDAAADTLVSVADAADHPAQVHALAPNAAPRRIETFNDDVMAGIKLGRVEERWFKGALGDKVQMWLFYPPDFNPRKKYPLLQNIHGGPHTAPGDGFHYRWNNPTFAAQGYVVACVNYHGSSSFGHAFLDSITHRWGELELQDIEAATDTLLKELWADPQRVFAAGGSYGGYMVAWMNGHCKPGRYQAYVCHAGCFDWTGMFADDAYHWHAKELGAWYWDDMARVHRQSPHAHAKHFRTPTLVVHGALDYRVPDAQGLAYYNTLQAKGIDTRLLWFPDENHWVLKPQNSRQWYGEYFAWLAKHDKADAKTAPKATGKQARAATKR
jgi:dipeptidyl aminopeptidase/acylaminoacyl peptidase